MAIDLEDKSQNSNTLTNIGATESATTPFVASTIAVDLEEDESDYLTAADSASLSITGDLTLECWFKPESLVGGRYTLVSKWKAQSDDRSYTFHLDGAQGLGLQWSSNGAGATITGSVTDAAIFSSVPTPYVHLAGALDVSAQEVIFYVDGSPVASTDNKQGSTSIDDNASLFSIGSSFDASGNPVFFSDGLVDEVRIWNDIRTAQEISDNYQIQLAGDEAGLVAYYPFEVLGAPPAPSGIPSYKSLLGVGR